MLLSSNCHRPLAKTLPLAGHHDLLHAQLTAAVCSIVSWVFSSSGDHPLSWNVLCTVVALDVSLWNVFSSASHPSTSRKICESPSHPCDQASSRMDSKGEMTHLGSCFQRVQFVVGWPRELGQTITATAAHHRGEWVPWLQRGERSVQERSKMR